MMIRKIAYSLGAGVAATIAACWVLALLVPLPAGALSRPSGVGEGWSYWAGRSVGSLTVMRIPAMFSLSEPLRSDYLAVRHREVPPWSAVHASPGDHVPRQTTYVEEARGWPMLALRCNIALAHAAQGPAVPSVQWGIAVTKPDARRVTGIVLPWRPIWNGFIVNSALFSLIVFAVLYVPGLMRRAARRRDGRCVRCGYDLRALAGSTACPECGEASIGDASG